MSARARLGLSAIGTLLLTVTAGAGAYDVETHRELSRFAASMSRLDSVLKLDLGVAGGVEAKFGQRPVTELVGEGAVSEDVPFFRVLNHFHDPLRPWDSAGLRWAFVEGQSSVRWGQNPDQDRLGLLGGTWSWPLSRRRYLEALTAATPAERERSFVDTFLTLGHLTHLVQDSAVPAHARNDPHPPLVNIDPYEDWVEGFREKEERRFFTMATAGKVPAASLLSPDAWSNGLPPVTRLLDSDTYLGLEPGVLGSASIPLGLAEFTNGNFLSRDTRFSREYLYPRIESLGLGFVESEGPWFRRYFPREKEGVFVEHFVAEGMLYESITAASGRSLPAAYVLTRAVHRDYANHLLPRAVGYSVALLDHFFRGRLEADIEDDPFRPGALRLASVNQANETLGAGGELSVLTEDSSGQRRRVGQIRLAEPVAPTRRLPPVELEAFALDAATRVLAVYQGQLGAEQADPALGTPGAVIGKVFRPAGVEEVFSDGSRWLVRTAAGVFPLPFSAVQYDRVQWGDESDVILAARFSPDLPSRVDLYRLARDPSGDVPFRLDASGVIQAVRTAGHLFAFGLATGTSVSYRHVVDYRQQLARVEQHVRLRHVEGTGRYDVLDIEFVGPDLETTVERPGITFEADFPIVLDAAHHASRDPEAYAWDLVELAADASGRVLALVVVTLTAPPLAARTEPVFAVDDAGRTVATAEVVTIVPRLPEGMPPMWFLVDLETSRVLASTAEPKVEIELRESRVDGPARVLAQDVGFYGRHRWTYVDGPSAGQEEVGRWLAAGFRTDTPPAERVRDVEVQGGFTALGVRGALRRELRAALAGAGFSDHVLAPTSVVTDLVYGCTQTAPVGGCQAIRVHGQGAELARTPASLDVVRRPRPAPGGRLLVLATDYSSGGPALGVLLVWDPVRAEAVVRYRPGGTSPADSWQLPAGTSSLALVTSTTFERWPDGPLSRSSTLVRLDGAAPPVVFPGTDLRRSFVLLDPDRLYNTRDLRFYRPTPPLTPTALPARLADAVPHAPGDFHVVRLP